MTIASYTSIIPNAKNLYHSGKHNEAFMLLQQSMQKVKEELLSLDENIHSQLISLSNEMELTSLSFAVQSIFLHNINARTTIDLLQEKIRSMESKTVNDEVFVHDLYDLLGLAYYYQEMKKVDKNFEAADHNISKSLAFRENSGSPKLAYSYFHKGLIQQYSGDTQQSLENFKKANIISQQDPYLLSFISRHLGFMMQQNGQIKEAKDLFEQSLQLRLDHSIMVYVPFSCITLADCYMELKEYERAEQLLHKAVEIGELIHQDRALALAHLSLAQYYENQHLTQQVLEAYLDSYYYARNIDHLGILNFILEKIQLKSDLS